MRLCRREGQKNGGGVCYALPCIEWVQCVSEREPARAKERETDWPSTHGEALWDRMQHFRTLISLNAHHIFYLHN
jgi:hypothetical protein